MSLSSSSSLSSPVKSAHGYNNLLKVDSTKLTEPRIGAEFQAVIPPLPPPNHTGGIGVSDNDTLMWSPAWGEELSAVQLDEYLRICCSGAAGSGMPAEEALRILGCFRGNVFQALREVLRPRLKLEDHSNDHYNSNNSTFSSHHSGSFLTNSESSPRDNSGSGSSRGGVGSAAVATWSPEEVDLFYEALCRNRKDFRRIAADIPGKSSRDCVEFYYVWKNLCREESQSFKGIINISQEELLDSGLAI